MLGSVIALVTLLTSKCTTNSCLTFGLARVDIIIAFLSVQVLWIILAFLVSGSFNRIYNLVFYSEKAMNDEADGKLVFLVACFGSAVSVCMDMSLRHGRRGEQYLKCDNTALDDEHVPVETSVNVNDSTFRGSLEFNNLSSSYFPSNHSNHNDSNDSGEVVSNLTISALSYYLPVLQSIAKIVVLRVIIAMVQFQIP